MKFLNTPFDRRTVLKGSAVALSTIATPAIVRGAEPAPIKVGILQPVTGALAQDGEYGRMGAELAIDDINKAGGIKALGGAKLEIVFGDARSTPEAGTQEVERMQEDGVVAVVGGFASPICLAGSQAAARYDLPYIVDVGVTDQIVQRGLKNTFRFAPGFALCTAAAIQNLVKINEASGKVAKTIALVHEDGLFGTGLAKLMAAELPKYGFEILELIAVPTPSRDLSNVTLRLRSLNPDLVIPSTYYGETVLLARTMQQQRVRPKAVYSVLNGAASNRRFVKEFPEAAENVMDVNHWHDPRNEKAVALQKRVEAAGKTYNYNVPLNYSCVGLLADAIERAGAADRTKIIDALATSTFAGHLMPYGPTKFENGQNLGGAPVSTQVQGGDIKVVFPEAFANAKPKFPANA
ncbi:ABC transporter substrate-binding protein [Rhizobium mayense]|uniref:ABC transporter substrate-binding protein n=1 Tax=Rhizobium mayense TaxID=1312184 RepID=A0ABT7K425_9HYPH|nr:ABC transporter substrate-binding protein [Rhizobium mayense]MDL2403366.1 ABC transporter substrate-binding protein [Rhizobium mayense]